MRRAGISGGANAAVFQFTHPGKGATTCHSPPLALRYSFNSRTLGRVRLPCALVGADELGVSIHAPWEGCDQKCQSVKTNHRGFNSRTLGRVRPSWEASSVTSDRFQFTHPGKGATAVPLLASLLLGVSIHAPWEGCDISISVHVTEVRSFNSRTLGRVRRSVFSTHSIPKRVSIHAPWEGCDPNGEGYANVSRVSIHAPWEGCDGAYV